MVMNKDMNSSKSEEKIQESNPDQEEEEDLEELSEAGQFQICLFNNIIKMIKFYFSLLGYELTIDYCSSIIFPTLNLFPNNK